MILQMTSETLRASFFKHFAQQPDITCRAPGRINLIGEHTDYNDGFVLPAAIDKAIWFAAGRRTDGRFAFYALDLDEFFISEGALPVFQEKYSWANYLLGVVSEARKDGLEFSGLNVVFGGDVPLGAGLSSSAALESGAMFIINELYGLGLSKMDIVRLAQRGENNFVGMKCGIMDMFASVMGKENAFVRLDCRSLAFEYFPFDTQEYSLVLCNSGVKHTLVDSEYNTRRAECEEGVSVLKKYDPAISSLRDVQPNFLIKHRNDFREIVFKRCKYVVGEIARVEQACAALQNNDFKTVGALMFKTHDGLNIEYQVSVPEINFMVEMARANPAVVGARMMGGGFGGCTINLVKAGAVENFVTELRDAYRRVFGLEMASYPVRLTDGIQLFHENT